MIDADTVLQIERLLAEGRLSQRRIAELTGVSRTFVHFVRHGRLRKPLSARRKQADAPSPPERCPGCGAMVTMPCVACRVRAYVAEARRRREAEHGGLP